MSVVTIGTLAVTASAAIRDSRGRFLFDPLTHNRDPINLIQIGGIPEASDSSDDHCFFGNGTVARTPFCFATHAGEAWKRGEMKERNVPPCNGNDDIRFRSTPPRRDPNNRDVSTSSQCKTQFNLRIWTTML